ncbi:MAG: HDOD domain-containing protein [Methylococcales bacterium]|nr:HDOD domain-containing protein [Methylococcales bacterium]
MNTNILLIESEGTALKKTQHNLIQSLAVEIFYLNDSELGAEVILQRQIGVIVANFGSDLKAFNDFCVQTKSEIPFFILFILLIDEKSGTAANEIKYAHQTLAVSCAEKVIIEAIIRGVHVSNEVQSNPKVALFLSKLDSLPSPPSVYFDLRDQLGSPSCNAFILTELISRDQALAAKILCVANSGFYAVPRTISCLQQAVTLLGTETLLGMVLATHLFDSLPLPGLNLDNLWKHAIGVALLARYIAKERGGSREQVEESGIAGLLHDLGCLVFISNKPAEYQLILRRAKDNESELIKNEKEAFGIDHAEIGAMILYLWGLPDTVVNAVKQHHHVDFQSTLAPSSPISVLAVAEWMFMFSEQLNDSNRDELIKKIPFDCSEEQFDRWIDANKEIQGQVVI